MIAALTLSPLRKKPRLFFALHKNQSINHQRVAWFLGQLLRHLRKRPLIVIWDNGRMHRGPAIRSLLKRTRRIVIKPLPPYAPDCDPVELLWSTLKTHRLANYVPKTLAALYGAARRHLKDIAMNPELLSNFLNACKFRQSRKTFVG